jgi:hypothetical protein
METSQIKAGIARQYHSSLTMLGKAIEACPEQLWLEGSPNRFWHIAYHALFYTHLYLSPTEADFTFRPGHRFSSQFLDAAHWDPAEPSVLDNPYSQSELLAYVEFCFHEAETRTVTADLAAPSGFYWLALDKFELQLYNIRHIQHHTGQLIERLRTHASLGVSWVR